MIAAPAATVVGIVSAPGEARAEIRRLPRPLGLRVGMPLKRALARLKTRSTTRSAEPTGSGETPVTP